LAASSRDDAGLITIASLVASEGQFHIAFAGLTAAGGLTFWRGYTVRSRFTE